MHNIVQFLGHMTWVASKTIHLKLLQRLTECIHPICYHRKISIHISQYGAREYTMEICAAHSLPSARRRSVIQTHFSITS